MRLESTFEKVDSSGERITKETAWGLLPRGAEAPLAMTEKGRLYHAAGGSVKSGF